jgi:D-3-phosphoglycerate dehydrogenase
MVGQMSHILGVHKVNIVHMINDSRGDVAYTLIDIEGEMPTDAAEAIRGISGVLNVRVI